MTFDFSTDFTEDKVCKMLPTNSNASTWFPALQKALDRYQIISTNRVAAFIAQTAYESINYTELEENLNYSVTGLLRVFSKYFTTETAAQYAHKPEEIANIVYANRMGNGNATSGDGWNYRGRGIIQLTGKENYTNASQDIYSNDFLVLHPWVVGANLQPEVPVEVACWFWNKNKLNRLADADDINAITYRINGGYNGKEDRAKLYYRNINILN